MSGAVWYYYEKIQNKPGSARCIRCKKEYSYKTTTTNLKKHLMVKHRSAYERMLNTAINDTAKTVIKRENTANESEDTANENENTVNENDSTDENDNTENENDNTVNESENTANETEDTVVRSENEARKQLSSSAAFIKTDKWDYFEIVPDKYKTALCILCNEEYSFKTTVTNLKKHLRCKHKIAFDNLSKYESATKKLRDNRFKGTTGNLTTHLQRYHENALKRLREAAKSQDDVTLESDEEASNTSLHQQDVYFEELEDQVKCTVCGKNISEAGEDPREHLEEHHPALLARIIKNEERAEEEEEDQNDKDVFTEIVYLDQISPPGSPKRPSKTKRPTPNLKKRKLSTNSDEYLIKTKKSPDEYLKTKKTEEQTKKTKEQIKRSSEIESFTNYIKILLEKLPQDVCSRVQLEIINIVMAAQFNLPSNSTTVHVQVLPSTSTVETTGDSKLIINQEEN